MHALGSARAEPHDGRRLSRPRCNRAGRRTPVQRRRRRARVGQHRKHGRARTIRMALRAHVLHGPCGAPPPARDGARPGPSCVVPAAWRTRSVCGCRGMHTLERHCTCERPNVTDGAARARRAGRSLSRRLSRRVVRAFLLRHWQR